MERKLPRRPGSMTMSDAQAALIIWVGAWCGTLSALIYCFGKSEEMPPLDRALLAVFGILIILWLDILLESSKARR